jgi:predicted DNA-binding transcriptional regulator YafY
MRETSARLLRLLGLLQVRPEWSGADLAGRLGITVRTLRRDVQRLRDLDYPVHSVSGVAGGYRLGPGKALPPLLLDDDEAIAVVVSLRSAASHSVAGLSEASVSALAKLDQVLPARLRERTAALQHATVALAGPGPVVDPEQLASLAAACGRHQRLRLRYRDRSGSASSRIVEPHRLVSTGYRWYLMAFDTERVGWRTFRVDRIEGPSEAGGRFVPRPAPDPATFVASAVTSGPYRYRARVLVDAPAAVVAEEFSRTSGVVTEVGQDRCLLATGSDSLGALTYHLASLGADFTVLEPPELIDFVGAAAGRLARAERLSARAAAARRGPRPRTPRPQGAGPGRGRSGSGANPGGREPGLK